MFDHCIVARCYKTCLPMEKSKATNIFCPLCKVCRAVMCVLDFQACARAGANASLTDSDKSCTDIRALVVQIHNLLCLSSLACRSERVYVDLSFQKF